MPTPQIITIGRAADNLLVVNKPSVSKYHATATFITDNVVLLEDKNSTFGTSVDGRRIQQTVIGPDSQVVLGQVERLDVRQILNFRPSQPFSLSQRKPKKDPLDYREEFGQLKKVQELYLEARESIQINNPRQQARLRAAFALLPLAGLALGPVVGSIGLAVGMLGSAVSQILAAEFLNPSQKLIALEKEFKRTYVCPNPACQKSFGNTAHADLAARKNCPACKARWSD